MEEDNLQDDKKGRFYFLVITLIMGNVLNINYLRER